MELTPFAGALVVLLVALVLPFAILATSSYLRWREPRLVRCPQTGTIARVDVDPSTAAFTAPLGAPDLELRRCTLWPRPSCAQACLADIQAAPEDCTVRNIVARWYDGKRCVFCKKTIPPVHLVQHHPALLDAEGETVEWKSVTPETLPDALTTHHPVCWDCHVAETFRRKHPELVVDRDSLREASRLIH